MRAPTLVAAAALAGLGFGAALGVGLAAAADGGSASPNAPGPPAATTGQASTEASSSPTPSSATSASPSAGSGWSVTLRAPGVDVLQPIALSGTVQAAPGDPARPTYAVLERWVSPSWTPVHQVPLTWTGSAATLATTYARTASPGTYALRLAVTTTPGVTVLGSVTVPVRAAIDISVSGPLTRADLPFTYRAGCPVPPSRLRRVDMNFWSFQPGIVARGSLIVKDSLVPDVRRAFTRIFAAHFPIHKMFPADRYGGKDVRAMAADDTSAFNCRTVTGNPYRISQHSYGNAIDINTWENPYVTPSHVYPSRHFLRRSPYRMGMIVKHGPVQRAFTALGWLWGARWSHPDYQHFSSNGG
ncbi:MAG TPA: M15 family metallopeptidase [Actinomycetes bacterium]|nr:M15 family metallopeptidase [Actinomycetes bacterium]